MTECNSATLEIETLANREKNSRERFELKMRRKTADRKSLALEGRVRFIWGFAIGFFGAFAIGFGNYLLSGVTTVAWEAILVCLGIGLGVGWLFGVLSRRWGDRFWQWLIRAFGWFV